MWVKQFFQTKLASELAVEIVGSRLINFRLSTINVSIKMVISKK